MEKFALLAYALYAFSACSFVFYVLTFLVGYKSIRGEEEWRVQHRHLSTLLIGCVGVTYLLFGLFGLSVGSDRFTLDLYDRWSVLLGAIWLALLLAQRMRWTGSHNMEVHLVLGFFGFAVFFFFFLVAWSTCAHISQVVNGFGVVTGS